MPAKILSTASTPNGETAAYRWQNREVLSSPGKGDAMVFPNGVENAIFNLVCDAGSAKLQWSSSLIEDIIADPDGVNVTWNDYPTHGSPTTVTNARLADSVNPAIKAIRQDNISGTSIFEVSIS